MSRLKKYFSMVPTEKQESSAIAVLAGLDHLEKSSPKVAHLIVQELKDQRSFLKLIASENYSSLAVQLAMGNWLTDKYAEGVPHHRFYSGCGNVDEIEQEAADLARQIFKAEHAYVQPHSGADANLVAFWAVLLKRVQAPELERLGKKNVDTLTEEEHEHLRSLLLNQKVMGMSLGSGGHLTHGYRHNVSAKFMHSVPYNVDPATGLIDYAALEKQALKERPAILIAGYSAYPRKIDFSKMRAIADRCGATLMVDMAHFAGLVAGGVMADDYNPVAFADIVTSTTHKTLRGPRGGLVLCRSDLQEFVDKGCPLVLGGPLPHVMAAKAVAFREATHPSFSTYAHQVVANARALAEGLMKRGIGVLTGGTDNHLVLFEVTSSFGLTGRQAEDALRKAHMTVNRNAIPFDPSGPWYTSGVRLGTPALTTLGMKEAEMEEIASCIDEVLRHAKPGRLDNGEPSRAKAELETACQQRVHSRVAGLLKRFPLYPEIILD